MDKLDYELYLKTSKKRDEIEIDATKPDCPKSINQDDAITYSVGIIGALEEKIQKHNSSHKKKVTMRQLKEVFCIASRDAVPDEERGKWALGRVNMFLRMVQGKLDRLSDDGVKSFKRIPYNKFVEITMNWTPSEEDLSLAEEVIEKHNLKYSFSSVDELYIKYQPTHYLDKYI